MPIVAWEPWDFSNKPQSDKLRGAQPRYRLSRIIDGSFDSYIRSWARGVRALDYTIGLRFAHEMNGYWYPWAEQANGNQPGQYVHAGEVTSPMATPLYELKAQFFRSLAHPARIRVLELLRKGERSVGELVGDVGLEASHLSQQLGVLRRAGLVTTRKQGTTVYYALSTPLLADLLDQTRLILTGVLNEQAEILRDLLDAHR